MVIPNLAFPIAAIGSILAMARNEPVCKERMDIGAEMIRSNVLGTLGEKMPFLKVFLGGDAPAPVMDATLDGAAHAETHD